MPSLVRSSKYIIPVSACLALLMASPLSAQTQASCRLNAYNPPSGYIYDLSPGGINYWNTVVGGVGGPTQGMETGFVRWSNGKFTLFNVPSFASTFFTRRNVNGTTVGWYGNATAVPPPGPGTGAHGLIYTSKSWATLNYPGSPSTALEGINKANTIVGNALDLKTKAAFGFQYQNGKFVKVQFPGAAQTLAFSINDQGIVVGWYQLSPGSTRWSGYILNKGAFKKLNYLPLDINNGGVIIDFNHVHFPDGRVAFVGTSAANSGINGLNDANVVTGFQYFGTFEFQGLLGPCK